MRAAGRLGGPGHQPGLCRASGRGASDRPSGNLKGKGKGRVCLGMGTSVLSGDRLAPAPWTQQLSSGYWPGKVNHAIGERDR